MMSSETEGPGSGSRRDFLRKVGIYGAPVILAGGAILETAARAAATPVETCGEQSAAAAVVSSQSSMSLSSATSTTNGCTVDPLLTLEADLATLEALTPPRGLLGELELDAAIAALKLATHLPYWETDYELVPKTGALVFAAIADAALALSLIANPPAAVTGVISDLVTVASTLANTAIGSATVSTARLNAANKAFSAGVTAGTKGQYVAAIADYGQAWADVSL